MKMSNASCLLLLALGVLAAAAVVSAHPRQHDPCKWNDFHGWTFVAETGEELDEEAMRKLPEAYIQYGWRHYRSGKCSYKGWEQRCPDYWHEKHGGHHFEEHWWDRHFKEPKCLGAACNDDDNCCSKNCANGFCCAAGKLPIDGSCVADNTKCCSGFCNAATGKCCIPPGSPIACTAGATSKCCFSSATTPKGECNANKCCLSNNEVCASGSEDLWKAGKKCCSGKCGKDDGTKKCCKPSGADCPTLTINDADCCSGKCVLVSGNKQCQ